ncbi:MAG TPA: class I SAM-dependent rRNA methyltransferase [Candidatus Eremiobacteraceae bacterium]|nr:class I SAM-dependent rRNA methyltransferase [Candidatus Eremiobacteraceae bacterium]
MSTAARLRSRRPERARHPWIFAGEIAELPQSVKDGEVATVLDHRGAFLARAYCNRRSKIVLRVLTWRDEPVDASWWRRRVGEAVARRGQQPEAGAVRLVNAEGDGLPGLVVDAYARWLAVQISTLGIESVRETIVDALKESYAPHAIFERSDVPERELEGLQQRTGALFGDPPKDKIEIGEGAARLLVDIERGQKTGLFLDQRLNRAAAAAYSRNRSVLNCFAYSGGFSVHAALAGASAVTSVDISADACRLARENMSLNGFPDSEVVEANCFTYLRDASDTGKTFGQIILDPPAFARGKATLESATRGYKEINLRAIKMLEPGGVLVTCSCSRPLSPRDFLGVLWSAAADAGRSMQIVEERGHPPDHPVSLDAPETSYLKCVILRAL